MRYLSCIAILSFLFLSTFAFAQDKMTAPIIPEKNIFGHYYSFTQDGNRLSYRQLNNILAEFPSTEKDVKAANVQSIYSDIFYTFGGIILGAALAVEIAGPTEEEGPNWGAALLVGGSLIGAGSYFQSKSDSYYKKAIDTYNSEIQSNGRYNQTRSIKYFIGVNIIGFSMQF